MSISALPIEVLEEVFVYAAVTSLTIPPPTILRIRKEGEDEVEISYQNGCYSSLPNIPLAKVSRSFRFISESTPVQCRVLLRKYKLPDHESNVHRITQRQWSEVIQDKMFNHVSFTVTWHMIWGFTQGQTLVSLPLFLDIFPFFSNQ